MCVGWAWESTDLRRAGKEPQGGGGAGLVLSTPAACDAVCCPHYACRGVCAELLLP